MLSKYVQRLDEAFGMGVDKGRELEFNRVVRSKSWKNLGARVFDGYICLRPAVILGLTEKQKTRSNATSLKL